MVGEGRGIREETGSPAVGTPSKHMRETTIRRQILTFDVACGASIFFLK